MAPRILDLVMSDEDHEALKKKLLEKYSVLPTLQNPTVQKLVKWHCIMRSCFWDKDMVFDKREKWMRHHQRFHNRMCASDRGYPKEVEAKQLIQEHERRWRESSRHGIIAGAGGSVGLMPPTATPAGPYSRISRVVRATPLNYAAPSSSTVGALRGASPDSAAPNSPRSGALRDSVAARRRGPRSLARLRAIRAERRQEHPHQTFVNSVGARQNEPDFSRALDTAQRDILLQQLRYNLQAVSRIIAISEHIMQILGYPKLRPAPAPAHFYEGPAHVVEATPYPCKAPANSNEAPAHRSQPPSLELALSRGGPAHSHERRPPLSTERRLAHRYEAQTALSIVSPAHPALTYMTPSQLEANEEEENYNAASDSERVDSDSATESDYAYINQPVDVSQDVNEAQVEWTDVKIEY